MKLIVSDYFTWLDLMNQIQESICQIMRNNNLPRHAFLLLTDGIYAALQKYRIFLKRVTETSNSNGSNTGKNSLERTLRSSFATGHPSLMNRALQPGFPQFMDHEQLGSSLQPGFLENIQMANGPSHCSTAVFPNQQASSNDFISQPEYGQFNSVNNQDYFQPKTPGNSKAFYLVDSPGLSSNQIQGRSQLLSSDVMSNTNGNMTLTLAGKLNNSGYCPQEAYSSSGLGSTSQFSPRFSDVIQQEYNPMLGNVSLPKFSENGLEGIYLNQPNKPFYNEVLKLLACLVAQEIHLYCSFPHHSGVKGESPCIED